MSAQIAKIESTLNTRFLISKPWSPIIQHVKSRMVPDCSSAMPFFQNVRTVIINDSEARSSPSDLPTKTRQRGPASAYLLLSCPISPPRPENTRSRSSYSERHRAPPPAFWQFEFVLKAHDVGANVSRHRACFTALRPHARQPHALWSINTSTPPTLSLLPISIQQYLRPHDERHKHPTAIAAVLSILQVRATADHLPTHPMTKDTAN